MNTNALKMIAAIAVAACFPGSALAVDTVILRGGAMHFRVSLGMSEQEMADTVGAPDILKSAGACYQYRIFDVSIMLDEERRVKEIYAGRNFSGAIIRDDGSGVSFAAGAIESGDEDQEPLELIFATFGEPLKRVRQAYAPSTDITGAVTGETESSSSAAVGAARDLPLEYRGDRVLYELYNTDGVLKYKYVLDKEGIAFWLDAEKKPYATVVFRTAPPAVPAPAPAAPPVFPTVYFDFDKDVLKAEYENVLAEQAQRIQADAALCVAIDGHADEKGTDPYNDDLSMRRARRVLDFLASRGAPAARMRLAAFGERVPAASNRTPEGKDCPEGRALNRRVTIIAVSCEP